MLSSSEKITQPPWAQKHLGMSVNLATFGGENKEYKIKSQPIDRFCLISLLYNWTYELMVSPTLYNLEQDFKKKLLRNDQIEFSQVILVLE